VTKALRAELRDEWSRHDAAWRDPAQVASQWEDAARVDRRVLRATVHGAWWELLDELEVTLLVSREYEHLLMAMSCEGSSRRTSFMRLPHPSGIAFDRVRRVVHVACTRNPNQVVDLVPLAAPGRPLAPIRARFLPGSLYLHDLALVGGELHGNAVGHNSVVRLDRESGYEHVWWPRLIDGAEGPDWSRNYIQLNSIAAGATLAGSYFSASADEITTRRPGHRNFPVDGRGVVFDGASREPVARGLTRPHSARLHGGELWVDNSGYGEVGVVADGSFRPVASLPGWTRGLCFVGRVAFVGVSRVIPRFRGYAPGLDVERSRCGVIALDAGSGSVLGSCVWPQGNQIFSIEAIPRTVTSALPFRADRRTRRSDVVRLFAELDPAAE
jgi:uncharacterized protein (TIGR03032 family)